MDKLSFVKNLSNLAMLLSGLSALILTMDVMTYGLNYLTDSYPSKIILYIITIISSSALLIFTTYILYIYQEYVRKDVRSR